MIVVSVQLWSANTGQKTELARLEICNDETGTLKRRNYVGRTLRGRCSAALDRGEVQRKGTLLNWPSEAVHIWNLVSAMLYGMGYGSPVK